MITNDELRAIIAGCKGVTPGPWGTDAMRSDGSYGSGEDTHEGFEAYKVTGGPLYPGGREVSICDTLNSDAASIEEEFGEESHHAWDEQGRKNMEHIARLSPEVVSALATELLASRASAEGVSEEMVEAVAAWFAKLHDDFAVEGSDPYRANDHARTVARRALEAALALSPAAQGKAEPAQAAWTEAEIAAAREIWATTEGNLTPPPPAAIGIVMANADRSMWLPSFFPSSGLLVRQGDFHEWNVVPVYTHPSPPSISAGRDEGLEEAAQEWFASRGGVISTPMNTPEARTALNRLSVA